MTDVCSNVFAEIRHQQGCTRIPGIYVIRNTANGKRYIGQSCRLRARQAQHFSDLRRGVHFNAHLQAAWNKYGEAAFTFEVLFYCPEHMLNEQEVFLLNAEPRPEYNVARAVGETRRGTTSSSATRARISAALRGVPRGSPSGATRARQSMAKKGKPQGPRPQWWRDRIRSAKRAGARRVDRIDPRTGEVREYESQTSATEDGFTLVGVNDCLRERAHTHRGYFWSYT